MVSGMIEAAKLLCHQLSRVSLSFALSDMCTNVRDNSEKHKRVLQA